jgi:hypothetical protein
MKKTVLWDDCKKDICTQALKILGPPAKEFPPKNFVELVSSFPTVSKKAMMSFLKANLDKNCFTDASNEVYQKENECLFISGKGYSTAIGVILRYLSHGNSAESVWCYLDIDKKAIVHFVNRNGWFAEAYFLSDANFSALHLVEMENCSLFIPVVFTTDLSEFNQNVSLRGDYYLQEYLPSDVGDLLSKKSGKKHVVNSDAEVKNGYDRGDCL